MKKERGQQVYRPAGRETPAAGRAGLAVGVRIAGSAAGGGVRRVCGQLFWPAAAAGRLCRRRWTSCRT